MLLLMYQPLTGLTHGSVHILVDLADVFRRFCSLAMSLGTSFPRLPDAAGDGVDWNLVYIVNLHEFLWRFDLVWRHGLGVVAAA
ncbi:hypothetical protein AK812_SmicGene45257 [Symbiodinium microadriaticum]|uniref:Uncharacterized protein n=1 Tax=Symbiodinium microadriaticum TaxID=2951 RepID=A0A1Q9BWI8_SYMMI|nr:hypothetical protein AK812_SmicGene45257 [Symbiodinium microadriaticum]